MDASFTGDKLNMKKATEDGSVYLSDVRGSAKLIIQDAAAIDGVLFDTDWKVPAPVKFQRQMDQIANVIFKAHMELEQIGEELRKVADAEYVEEA
jgi:hypothetical protein